MSRFSCIALTSEKENRRMKSARIMIPLVFILILLLPDDLKAQRTTIDCSGIVQQMAGGSGDIGGGRRLEPDNILAYGFGGSMNFSGFALSMDLIFGSSNRNTANNINILLIIVDYNIEYEFMEYQITPIAQAGVGLMRFTESYDGMPRYNTSAVSYNAGAGFKWAISDHLFLKGILRITSTKFLSTTEATPFHGVSIGIGYSIPVHI